MSTIHVYLRERQGDLQDPSESILFGPSPSNQIERWWRELHDRLEKYFKAGLCWLKEECHYDPSQEIDRYILAYIMIPVMQRELNEFRDTVWNTHRIRAQKDTLMADGVPNHIYEFPDRYGMEKKGFHVSQEDLAQVAKLSGVLDAPEDYIPPSFRKDLDDLRQNPEEIKCNEFVQSYLTLKQRYFEMKEI